MIISRTYKGVHGLNYIQASELAFAIIYIVKREGLQYDKFISGNPNRTHTHESSTGKISFPIVFSPGDENVFVLFKTGAGTEPETPPGVCVPVSVPDDPLSPGVKDTPYNQIVTLTGSQPFTVTVNDKPSWMTVTNATDKITFSGTPDTEGDADIDIDISNECGSGEIVQTITVYPPSPNLIIINASSPGTFIGRVIGIPHYRLSGGYPLPVGSTIQAVHSDYTGIISVQVSLSGFPRTLSLLINSVIVETIPVTTVGAEDYVFSSQSYLSTDQIQIVLN